MKKALYTLLYPLYIGIAHAQLVTGTGAYIYDGNVTENFACSQAEIKARTNIMEKIGNTSFSHRSVLQSSDDTPDGRLTQQSVEFGSAYFKQIISKTQTFSRQKAINNSDQKYNVCSITLQAEVSQFKTKADPSFTFSVTLPRNQYFEGDLLEFDITPAQRMYVYVFLWQPQDTAKEYVRIYQSTAPISKKRTIPDTVKWKLVSGSVGNTADVDTLYILATKQPFNALASYTFQEFNTTLFKIERENWDLKTIHYTIAK